MCISTDHEDKPDGIREDLIQITIDVPPFIKLVTKNEFDKLQNEKELSVT